MTHSGHSLIGTLAGLTLGTGVMLMAWQAWATLRWTSQNLQAVAAWEANARPLSALWQRMSVQAGSSAMTILPEGTAQLSPWVPPVLGIEGGGTQSDSFTVWQERAQFPQDCQGNELTGPATLANQFKLNSKYELTCKDTQRAGSLFQALSERVEDLQVRYIQRTGSLSNPRWQWLNAAQVSDWSRVQGAEVCLRIASATKMLPGSDNVQGCQGETVPRDGRHRRLWRQVLGFRHAAP
jgi:hypothetical protein